MPFSVALSVWRDRERGRDAERETGRGRERDTDRGRERERQAEGGRETQTEGGRERERQRLLEGLQAVAVVPAEVRSPPRSL